MSNVAYHMSRLCHTNKLSIIYQQNYLEKPVRLRRNVSTKPFYLDLCILGHDSDGFVDFFPKHVFNMIFEIMQNPGYDFDGFVEIFSTWIFEIFFPILGFFVLYRLTSQYSDESLQKTSSNWIELLNWVIFNSRIFKR